MAVMEKAIWLLWAHRRHSNISKADIGTNPKVRSRFCN